MRLQGAPPDGEIALSYVTDPQGTIVGSADRPIGHILPLPGQTGPQGTSNVLSIGTVTKGVDADATITGTSPTQSLNLILPQGDKGDKGDQGIQGATGPTDWNLITNKPDLSLKEDKANKGVANGYAPLGSDSKVPAANLPSYVDDVLDFTNLAAFPATGEAGKIYVADDTNKTYRWNTGSSAYIEISPSPGSTDAVAEGAVNKYYTDARADARVVAGITGKADKTTTVSAGTGLTGGGALSANQTLAVSYGSTAGTSCQGNDSRLSDTRTPTANSVTSAMIVDGTIVLADLSATGTKDNTTFLRGDNTWATPPGSAASGINLLGTLASRPAAGTAGRMYHCTDCDAVYRDSGTAWVRVRFGDSGISAAIGDVPTTGWTASNLVAGSTWAADLDAMLLTANSGSGHNVAAEYRTYPGSAFTLKTYLDISNPPLQSSTTDFFPGIVISDGTKYILWGLDFNNAGGTITPFLRVYQYTTSTAFSSSAASTLAGSLIRSPRWFGYTDDGTNAKFLFSYNGIDWLTLFSQARAVFLTPSRIGIGIDSNAGSAGTIRVRSWSGVS